MPVTIAGSRLSGSSHMVPEPAPIHRDNIATPLSASSAINGLEVVTPRALRIATFTLQFELDKLDARDRRTTRSRSDAAARRSTRTRHIRRASNDQRSCTSRDSDSVTRVSSMTMPARSGQPSVSCRRICVNVFGTNRRQDQANPLALGGGISITSEALPIKSERAHRAGN